MMFLFNSFHKALYVFFTLTGMTELCSDFLNIFSKYESFLGRFITPETSCILNFQKIVGAASKIQNHILVGLRFCLGQ